MRHARAQALDRLQPLLVRLRRHVELKEKSHGVFYFRSKALLHFHEDPTGLFADFRSTGDWRRFSVNTKDERDAMLRVVATFMRRTGSVDR